MTELEKRLLQRSVFFRFMPEGLLSEIADLLQRRSYRFGEVIIREGDEADAWYLLASGRARVLRNGGQKGEEVALDTLHPGEEFGEQALVSGEPRNATVRCSTSVDVLRLRREDFLNLTSRYPEVSRAMESLAKFRTLRRFLFERSEFGKLPEETLEALVNRLEPCEFQDGTTIVKKGESSGPLYIMESGRARAIEKRQGREVNLAFYREGDYFGELSALTGSPRAATVVAESAVRLYSLSPEAFDELGNEFPMLQRLFQERRDSYLTEGETRVPLDFAEDIPAEARAANKVSGATEESSAENEGWFAKKRRRIRRISHVQQIDAMDCGAACLGMVCRYFGKKVGLSHIRKLCHTARDGTSLRGICHAATEVGLAARALKVSTRNLENLPLPAIVHWEGNHWNVLFDVGKKHVRVQDPAFGSRKYSRAEFERGWTGYTALFDYTESLEDAPEEPSMWRRFLPFFRRFTDTLVLVALLALVVTGLQMLFPIATQIVVDRVIVDEDPRLLVGVLVAMAAAIVFAQIASLLQEFLLSFTAVRIDAALLDYLTRSLLGLPMSYFQSRRTGDIQRRLNGAEQVRAFAVQHGIGGALGFLTLLGAVTVMLAYSLPLAGVFFATLPLYWALMWWSKRYLRPIFADIEEAQGRYSSHQIDAIKGIEAVKAAAAEGGFRDAILNEFLGVARKMFRAHFILMSYDGVLKTIGMLATAFFLWIGAQQVMAGDLTVGGFVAFTSLAAIAYGAILRVLGLWDQLQLVTVLLNRLDDVFAQEPEQGRDRSRLRPVPTLEGRIELRDVCFRYGGPEAPEILRDIDLAFLPGKTTAIVGRSGSGKTTLVKLLAGLNEPTSGTVLLDRIDLRTLNYRDVRRQVGIVLQENHIFSDTVAGNIAFGDPEPDFDRVLKAAKAANAHEFVRDLPLGYDTKIGESGLALSGGQRQRVAIARALYGDPPILVFDEATSALDTESERAIQGNLESLASGRTCVVIAHRLSTVRNADNIVVLERGAVTETGTHEELMALRGLYFHLCSQQIGL